MPEANRLRIFQPGRIASGRAVVRAPQGSGTSPGHSGAAPGHGNVAPGHGGVPPGLVSAFTAIAVASSTGVVTPGRPDPYRAVVLADAPLAYWRLGEASGTVVGDSSSTGTFTGTYINTPTLDQAGIPGAGNNSAVKFNSPSGTGAGLQQAATFGDVLPLNGTKFSLEFWISVILGVNSFTPFVARGDTTWRVSTSAADASQIQFSAGAGQVTSSSIPTLNDGHYHHIVCVYDQAHLLIYFDTVVKGSTAWTTNLPTSSGKNVGIGYNSDATSRFIHAIMDEVAIYNTALSPARITAHYNAGITS